MKETYKDICASHGTFEGVRLNVLGSFIDLGCQKCNAERVDQERIAKIAEDARREAERIAIGINLSNIPHRYRGMTSFIPRENQEKAPYDAQKNLVLVGGTGSGKTAYACHLGLKSIYSGLSVRYLTASEFVAKVKSSWSSRVISEEQIIDEYVNCDLLILDEIGRGGYDEYLFRLFDGRYNLGKVSILVGNVTMNEIKTVLGEAIASRLRGGGVVGVSFGNIDHRAGA